MNRKHAGRIGPGVARRIARAARQRVSMMSADATGGIDVTVVVFRKLVERLANRSEQPQSRLVLVLHPTR